MWHIVILLCIHFNMGLNVNNNNRVIQFAQYIISNNATIRQTAAYFGYSKSTVHLDIHKKLKKINFSLFDDVNIILRKNFDEKHIRGGLSTKNKYLKK